MTYTRLHRSTRIAFCALFALACGPFAHSAEAADSERTYTFRVFTHHRAIDQNLFFMATPDTPTPLTFLRGQRSADVAYRGPSLLTFFVLGPVDPATGLSTRLPQAQVRLPDHDEPWLLVFFPAPDNAPGLPLRIIALRDGESALPNDHLRFLNATGTTLSGVFGDVALTLPPGASDPIDLRPFYDQAVPIGFGVRHTEGFSRVYAAKLQFAPGARRIFLLLPPRTNDSLRILVREIIDFPGLAAQLAADGTDPKAPITDKREDTAVPPQ